eukprot:CAMPEP_0174350074 /NCGR_PEP_ID=MMETSP0811_2-20130205/7051_1 /TAXON_ID=73025 ORGANISM="Eutreptiella gymnastica-like, Strain CCMP1594" /NCGR_SAMPLE_ID=MMETSP0811_2 /ASSEMBLY_ACC=CAM_ASM_000667 /LENGTH=275 /DNA_ID=CAMNT_0015478061 /DNA_START=19 /DNA_END=845 /DNA_ORIENTATION=+
MKNDDAMVWVDLEMTGLDVDNDVIMEMACLITDKNLQVIAEGPNIVIHVDDAQLNAMNDWCKTHHGQSGLTDACRKSEISLAQAEAAMLEFVAQHVPPGKCPLAGNSIHADKKFLDKYMPKFMGHLHYRIVDVSSLKELCRRWYPREFTQAPKKGLAHRALDDIKESLAELQYYRSAMFKDAGWGPGAPARPVRALLEADRVGFAAIVREVRSDQKEQTPEGKAQLVHQDLRRGPSWAIVTLLGLVEDRLRLLLKEKETPSPRHQQEHRPQRPTE